MTDFLLELRSEEIPARMQAGARADLEKLFRKEMKDAGVSVGGITVYSTPRRLALIAKDLPVQTEAVREETKGPATSAPEQALEGFLRKTGLSKDQLEVRDIKGKDTYFAVVEKPGRAVKDVLAEAIPAIIRAFPWPKSQRWGAASLSPESLRWVRPLSGIVSILGDDLVECAVEGITSGRVTKGHRFHASGEITLSGADTYVETLRAAYVLVDHAERQDLIRSKAAEAASAAGLTLVEDEGLVIENAGLTEWPVPLLGRFDEDFLEVPPETIQLTARVNQKYFVCEKDGKLADAFVCTANIAAVDGGEGIVAGNRKVLAARLSDARFFWEQDRKTPLSKQAEKLGRITFHEKLGTVADKVERVAKLAEWLAAEGIVPDCDPALARKAAELCKADLVTEMVGEFPELQGLMGGYYARAEGLGDEIADAIRDHYKPVGAGDDVPTAPVSVAVALADKLDTLRSFFAIDEKPTGSKDPFALRRAALGVIRLITDNKLRFGVAEGDLLDFFADRLKVQQKEAGVRHDLIDAVFALGGEDDLVRLLARVHALQAFVQTDDGANLLAGYKRANNILKKEGFVANEVARTGDEDPMENVDDPDMTEVYAQRGRLSYTPEPAEQALMDALAAAAPKAVACVEAEDFAGAMAALASLRAPIDAFFNDVTVNDSDPAKRTERLGLLDRFRAAVHKVADFSRIEG
ncbi:glycine--tRNA ligase subunit beta [Novosphingobium mangrovi (ex Hu et al. 2023)]|uniref:Glycine--tRNA ligase beta subunit n=1 Tax=Novosphingobium mangrovi (ex Hu et al. 2023) TaxID=2930094 RepID=A0ABT0A9G0_9SPHN|nr:glycine--tRNA ligase subunit beta [Novosphingobium mangrovi (ex Hu et al. 2023)]MCJ1959825.1 glycine--tRNA ligase subunit beta [Novosphingobium mangrovi (ex Hu et al. 2023)]